MLYSHFIMHQKCARWPGSARTRWGAYSAPRTSAGFKEQGYGPKEVEGKEMEVRGHKGERREREDREGKRREG